MLSLTIMQTNLTHGIVAATKSTLAARCQRSRYLKLLIGLGIVTMSGSASAEVTWQQEREVAAMQTAIAVFNKPRMTTDDIIRVLQMKAQLFNSHAFVELIGSRAYQDPHLTFSMTPREVSRLQRAGATPELIAAMRSPVSVAHPPQGDYAHPLKVANPPPPAAAQAPASGSAANVELIIDASGSMAAKIGGRSKMDIAKQALTELLLSMPSSDNVAVRAYGHHRKDDCNDIELVANFGEARSAIPAKVGGLKPLGKTPLSSSIGAAAKDFAGKEGQDNTVILITDGEETCNADPCAAARLAHESGVKVKINVIGFKIEPKERAQLECIANAGGGKYVSANDAKELTAATQQVALAAPATPAAPPPAATANPVTDNLLAVQNGGQLLVAPGDGWMVTNDGQEECGTVTVPSEAVYAFKDEQPAMIDRFSTFVPDASGTNLKEFELLVADDSPTGTFRSLGTFTAQNAKILKSPYQEFKFEPVTAKYLKVKLISNYNMSLSYNTRVCEFGVHGKISEKTPAPEGAASVGGKNAATNLLSVVNGGKVLLAADEGWRVSNDGQEECGTVKVPAEAVYAFKDEQPATFDTFSTLVPDAWGRNLKEFELLAGDESPTGTFRSIGTFTAQNAKMLKSPYQEFKFEPVTAKYLKVKLISNYDMSLTYNTRVCEFKVYNSGK